jgi:ActR/RegA family two-component response regulator
MLNDPSRLPEVSSSFEDEVDRGLLLVDDDAVSCARMAREMARKGFDVRTAASVREGIEIANRERPR